MKTAMSRLPVSRTRTSSLSRTQSSTSLNTPRSSLRRSKSSVSLRPTPQSGHSSRASSQSRNRSVDRARIKKKDCRPIQDKKWQAVMQNKVQAYFQHFQEAVEFLNKGVSIRPITLNMFVQLTNIILCNIDAKYNRVECKLTLLNYTELLPIHLNILRYPGSVTASTLKTANTMHSWPHILAILSWLVELHELLMSVDTEEILFGTSPDAPLDEQISKFQTCTIMEFFNRWNSGNEITNQEEVLIRGYKEILKYPDGMQEEIEDRLKNLMTVLENRELGLQQQNEGILKLNQEIMGLKNTHKQIEDNIEECKVSLKDIESKKYDFIGEMDKIKKKITKGYKVVENLKRTSEQTVNVEEHSKDQTIIEELLRTKEMFLQKKMLQHALRDEKDMQLSNLKRDMDQKLNEFNMQLLRPALNHPDLKQIGLSEDRLFQLDLAELLKEKKTNKEKLLYNVDKEIQNNKDLLSNLQEKLENQYKENATMKTEVEDIQIKLEEVRNKYESTVKNKEESKSEKEKSKETLKKIIDECIQENINLENELRRDFDHFRELTNKNKELHDVYSKTSVKMLEFFENLDKEITENQLPKYQKSHDGIKAAVDKKYEKYKTLPKMIQNMKTS